MVEQEYMQNILGIIDSSGNLVIKYEYTTYGTIKSITGSMVNQLGYVNSFRYKGYYYDTETKMYYCKSRYYNPEWCRWLNADHIAYLNLDDIDGINLFSYCGNNPIMLVDDEGDFAISIGFAITIGLASLFAGATATVLLKPEVYYEVEQGLQTIENSVKKSIANSFVVTSIPFLLSFVVLDNVLLSKKKGNLKETGAPEEIPSEGELREKYQDARKRGDQEEAKRIQLLQKVLRYRNKQKRNGKKPKGSKGRNIILAILIHDIIRRF